MSIRLFAYILGLAFFGLGMVYQYADRGLDASSLEGPSGLVRIVINEPTAASSMAQLRLPEGVVSLAVDKTENALAVTVVNAPPGIEYAPGQRFTLVYQGSRLFACEGACGRVNILQG